MGHYLASLLMKVILGLAVIGVGLWGILDGQNVTLGFGYITAGLVVLLGAGIVLIPIIVFFHDLLDK